MVGVRYKIILNSKEKKNEYDRSKSASQTARNKTGQNEKTGADSLHSAK
jgi:hypothetical protein